MSPTTLATLMKPEPPPAPAFLFCQEQRPELRCCENQIGTGLEAQLTPRQQLSIDYRRGAYASYPRPRSQWRKGMIRLIAFAVFALALATSAQAMPRVPLHQPDGMTTQVRYYGFFIGTTAIGTTGTGRTAIGTTATDIDPTATVIDTTATAIGATARGPTAMELSWNCPPQYPPRESSGSDPPKH